MKQSRLYLLLACGALCLPAQGVEVYERAVIGGGVGGATGAAIGSAIGGREGAVIGGAIGGATGAAIATHDSNSQSERPQHDIGVSTPTEIQEVHVHHHYPSGRHDNGRHLGHYKHRNKTKHKGW